MDYRFKIWLEEEGEPVLGNGLLNLLNLIRRYGSIKRAAEEMRMSYRQAWGNIKKAETRLGFCLLVKQIGGETGGGAQLTPDARELIAKYEAFRSEVEAAVKDSFVKYFG
ncbi:MAG: LysR family transcriptional regulator [Clostridia bacterium]|nr:LysR family transcriptional regulator [Clostridia bacterium]